MKTLRVGLWIACLLQTAGGLFAQQATGTLKEIDAENGVVVVNARGQDRRLRVDEDTKVLGAEGKDLPDGLESAELKAGVEVTVTVERRDGGMFLKTLRLGRAEGPAPEGGRETVGLKPLTEMTAEDKYKGEDGGLYGEGRNDPPAALLAAAKAESALPVPLDAEGRPAKDGTIALVSISMSNATQEFSRFKQVADADPDKSKLLTIVDCAQGGQAMAQWAPPDARTWTEAERRLTAARVTPAQVQVAWIKLANVRPTGDLAEHGKKLQKDTIAVLHNAKARFPNLRVAYLGSRIYAGYASTALNPEPYAYEGAFAARWLIRDQIDGDPDLNWDPARGAVEAPLLLWGPYLWADGITPRKGDGLVWERKDLGGDGTHPSDSGRQKVADLLLTFFKTDPLARTWFTGSGGGK